MISILFLFMLLCIAWPLITWRDFAGDSIDEGSYVFILVLWLACLVYGISAPYMYLSPYINTSETHRSNYDKDDYAKQGTNSRDRAKDRGQNVPYRVSDRAYR